MADGLIDNPALEHTFKNVKYTCKGDGLLKDGFSYEPKLEKLLPARTIKASLRNRNRQHGGKHNVLFED